MWKRTRIIVFTQRMQSARSRKKIDGDPERQQYFVVGIRGNFDDAQTGVKRCLVIGAGFDWMGMVPVLISEFHSTLAVWYHRLFIMYISTQHC